MREFFLNVTRYPRYLVTFTLGVMNSVAEPLAQRRSNPVTAVAMIGALISGFISLSLVLRAMGEWSTNGVMAQGRRVERVAALIRKETSELLINGIRDERVHKGMVSITSVEVAGDLQHCKIFVSIFGEPNDQNEVLEGLEAASGYLRGELGRRLQMRRAPEVKFQLDRGLEKGTSVLGLLNHLEDQRQERGEIPLGSDEHQPD